MATDDCIYVTTDVLRELPPNSKSRILTSDNRIYVTIEVPNASPFVTKVTYFNIR